jgi:hypothetical protein
MKKTLIKIVTKIIVAVSSLVILYQFMEQIDTGGPGNAQAGVLFILFFVAFVLPYLVLIFAIDTSKNEKVNITLEMKFIVIFSFFGILSFMRPFWGALIGCAFPLVVYISIFSKKHSKIKLIAIIAGVLYLIAAPYFFIKGTDLGYKLNDPCWGRYYIAKGPVYEIRDDRVCLEYYRGPSSIKIKTLEGADPITFEKFGRGYYKDKNHIYYGHLITGADVETFKHENNIFSDKNGVWENGQMITFDIK